MINPCEMKPLLIFLWLFAGPVLAITGLAASGIESGAKISSKHVIVPQVVGYPLDQAKGILSSSHLETGTVVQKLSNAPAEQVIAQEPQPGTKAARGSVVNLTVSVIQNVLMVSVPDVKGLEIEEATQVMQEAGLPVEQVYYKISTKKEGKVYKQQPVAGEKVKSGTPVFLVVSRHKHIAAWIIWIIVLIAIILNERLFKWKARRDIKNHHSHPNHNGKNGTNHHEKK